MIKIEGTLQSFPIYESPPPCLAKKKRGDDLSLLARESFYRSSPVSFFKRQITYISSCASHVMNGSFVNLKSESQRESSVVKPSRLSDLVPVLVNLGYKTNSAGLCFGFVWMGISAIVLGDIRTYDERLEKINRLIVSREFKKTDEIDLSAFFNGIALYSEAYRYPHLFNDELRPSIQNDKNLVKALSPLIAPDSLRKKGGVVQVAHFSGLYREEDLKLYFESLQRICRESASPFALQIVNMEHSIAVGYDPIKKSWIFIGATDVSSLKYTDLDVLAKMVLLAFFDEESKKDIIENPLLSLSTTVLATAVEAEVLSWQIANWQSSFEFQSIHEVTGMKSSQTDAKGCPWLVLAANMGDLISVNQLIMHGAYIDETGPDDVTSLLSAAQNGHAEVVRVLLKNGANLSRPSSKFCCDALVLASQNNHLEIVVELLNAESDVNAQDPNGPTALMQAALAGHLEVVRFLLEKKAEVNKQRLDGSTALMMAANYGHLTIVQDLLKAGADPCLLMTGGYSAYLLALEKGHLRIAAILEPIS